MYTFDWLAKRADLAPDKVALVDGATGAEFTYAQFNERAGLFARFLQEEWRIEPGDRVAILAHNCLAYFEILYGCAKAGAILVPLNWRLAVPELTFIMNDCTPRGLIYDPAFASQVQELRSTVATAHYMALAEDAPAGVAAYEEALAAMPGPPLIMPARDGSDIWNILYTSGTTGRPKGVLQTFEMAVHNYLNIGIPIALTAADTTLNVLPFFHTGGLNLYTNPTILVGGTAIIQSTFDPAQTLQLLSERATVFFGVPAHYLFMSQHPSFEQTDLSGVRSWACGGAPMPVNTLETYAQRGIIIQQGFGMTETGPTVFLIDKENAIRKGGSVGKPQISVEVRIVDRAGNDVAPGEMGELLVRGSGVTPGYWQLPDITRETIEPDGWLHSGDVARCDEDGYYYIVDRWKDMYISGGENVYPAEVENVLYAHPAVAEAAVIGIPDEKWGEIGKAIIVVKPGTEVSEREIIDFCAARLARYKLPRSVAFIDQLPRNAAGKVLKRVLRDQFTP